MSTEGQIGYDQRDSLMNQLPPSIHESSSSSVTQPRSRGLLIILGVGIVIVVILVLMFFLGGGVNLTISEVALGLGAMALVGGVAFMVGKKSGDTLKQSVKYHAKLA